jgi:thymidylate synthase (FAD)
VRIVGQSFEVYKPETAESLYERIETAGRVSWRSEGTPEAREDFIRKLVRKGHESVLEHGVISAVLVTDRGVMAELTRHRLASFTVESTRYVRYDDPESFKVVRPFGEDGDMAGRADEARVRDIWRNAVNATERGYNNLVKTIRAELARAVLPQCFATRIFMTANVREWRHVMRLRTSPAAHPKMRELMGDGLAKLKALYPVLFEDIG